MDPKLKLDFYLIRHGQTNRNVSGLIGQDPNEPLNQQGLLQAHLLKQDFLNKNIKFDKVYSSPYSRALETCRIVTTQTPIIVENLREINQGNGTDKVRTEVFTEELKATMDCLGMGFKFPNGECMFEVERRMKTWLEQEMLSFNGSLSVAVFSHGIAIKSLLHHLLEFNHRFTWRVSIENTSVTKLHTKDGYWFLDYLNSTSHLTHAVSR